jgi:hypothetical protein
MIAATSDPSKAVVRKVTEVADRLLFMSIKLLLMASSPRCINDSGLVLVFEK